MTEVQIKFDEISEGDLIRTVRVGVASTTTVEGIAFEQDYDNDWTAEDGELLSYHEAYGDSETYYLLKSGSLPEDPGSLIAYPNHWGKTIYALKVYGEEGWYTTFPDGSSAFINDLYISRKNYTVLV